MSNWVDAARARKQADNHRCSECREPSEDCSCAERSVARALDLVDAADKLIEAIAAGAGVEEAAAWYLHTRYLP